MEYVEHLDAIIKILCKRGFFGVTNAFPILKPPVNINKEFHLLLAVSLTP